MKLTDLSPRWVMDANIVLGGQVVHDENRRGMGISFACPCCVGTPRAIRIGVFVANPIDGKAPADDGGPLWFRAGETFETMTLTPSVDARAHGHWHGFITNGEAR